MAGEMKLYYPQPSGLRGEAIVCMQGDGPQLDLKAGARVVDWPVPHFDVGVFDEMAGKFVKDAPGQLTDFLNNDRIGWLIVSYRVMDLLAHAGVALDLVQWLGVRLRLNGEDLPDRYVLANVLDVRSAVHPAKSRFVGPKRTLTRLVLQRQAVVNARILRVLEWPTTVYFSEELKKVLDRAKVTGIDWQATPVES